MSQMAAYLLITAVSVYIFLSNTDPHLAAPEITSSAL